MQYKTMQYNAIKPSFYDCTHESCAQCLQWRVHGLMGMFSTVLQQAGSLSTDLGVAARWLLASQCGKSSVKCCIILNNAF